jgi:hypothetical protein
MDLTENEAAAEDRELLLAHATEIEPGRWVLNSSGMVDRDASATLLVIRACVTLGVPVSDLMTARAWGTLVAKVAALEARAGQ